MDLRFWHHNKPATLTDAQAAPKEKIAPKPVFDYDAANRAFRKPASTRRPAFVFPSAAPGVIPKEHKIACDAAMQQGFDYAVSAYQDSGLLSEGLGFMGYPYLSELLQRAEYRNAVDTISQDMTRKWITLQCTGDDKNKSDKMKAIEAEMKRLGVQQAFRTAMYQGDGFGRSQIYIDTGASDDPAELKTPLVEKPTKVGKGAMRALRVIEPIWTYPNTYNSNDPLLPNFFRPETWFVLGKEIHSSRLLTIVPRAVPDMLKPAYAFGGLSLTQIMKPYVDNWLRTRQSVSDGISNFSIMVLLTNLSTVLNAGSGDDLLTRARLFNAMRDNGGLMVADKDTEDLKNVSMPLGSLDHLQAQSQEHMSAVTRIPLVKLTGISPSGLNASSDGEIRVYYDNIEAQQEAVLTAPLSKIINIIQLSLFGEIDPEIGFRWEPLWSLDKGQESAARKTDADTDCELIDHGVLTPQEVRIRLAADEDSPYAALDLAADLPEAAGHAIAPDGDEGDVGDRLGNFAADAGWEEGDHPRGQPGNAGQFGAGGNSAGEKGKPTAESMQRSAASESSKSAAGHLVQAVASESGERRAVGGGELPEHVRALKLPPAWTDVRYSPDPAAALQAIGKDAKGRSQYVYSKEFTDSQSAAKFERINELSAKFSEIESENARARASDNPRVRDSADCAALIMSMGIRPGSEVDTKAKAKAYGATTIEGRHVVQTEGGVRLQFVGKEGVNLDLPVTDDGIAAMLLERKARVGDGGQLFGVNEKALLDYIHTMDGGKFKSKDFRTLLGTKTAMKEVENMPAPKTEKEYNKSCHVVAKAVSQKLGNTPTVALQSYISPAVFAAWRSAL